MNLYIYKHSDFSFSFYGLLHFGSVRANGEPTGTFLRNPPSGSHPTTTDGLRFPRETLSSEV